LLPGGEARFVPESHLKFAMRVDQEMRSNEMTLFYYHGECSYSKMMEYVNSFDEKAAFVHLGPSSTHPYFRLFQVIGNKDIPWKNDILYIFTRLPGDFEDGV
jgi:hypothetical protein